MGSASGLVLTSRVFSTKCFLSTAKIDCVIDGVLTGPSRDCGVTLGVWQPRR